jgi:hypothetical protein
MLVKTSKNKKPDYTAADFGFKSKSFRAVTKTKITPRVIGNIEAPQKVGKTDFCIRNAPDPIVIFNFDQGLEGVVEKHRAKGKIIIVAGIPDDDMPEDVYPSYAFARPIPKKDQKRKGDEYLTAVKREAGPMWEQWIADYREFLENKKMRTGVVDTGGGAFSLGKFAYVGMDKYKPGQDDPYGQKTGDLKSIFQGLITDAYSYDKNVLWLHRLKNVFDSPGEYEIDGYKQLPFEVQLTLRLARKVKTVGTGKDRERINIRTAEVRESRIGSQFNGTVYSSEDKEFRFDHIMSEIFGTDIEDWQ